MVEFEVIVGFILAAFAAGYALRGWVGKEITKASAELQKVVDGAKADIAKAVADLKAKI